VSSDAAGNLFRRRGADDFWIGSHLGMVLNGGRLDGALGVVAGIEVAERLLDRAARRRRFPRRGYGPDRQPRAHGAPTRILELQIEQGPVLERLGEPMGLVIAIVGRGARSEGRRASRA
jgi:hypothetical protein